MNDQKNISVSVESTPNPHSMKFTVNQVIAEENWETEDINTAGRSPLAQKILGFPWAEKVFIGSDFITINKADWVEWETLIDPLAQMIQEHIESQQVVLSPPLPENTKQEETKDSSTNDSETVSQIKQILEKEIQPAVAMDGGFISFAGFEKGTVFLKMQGACSGCPSASITLKQGIENHLKNKLPEVQQVVAV